MIQANINGQNYNIAYSSTGQPSIYLGWSITYDMRNICVIENDDYHIEYYYNANGIRVGKSINNGFSIESVNYILDGSNIIRETHTGASNYTMEYYYDSNDSIIGFTYNGSKFLYLKNLQNDIIGIIDSSNNIVVKYYYDAYGRIVKTLDTSGINLSSINPFRYRGYYQDNETGWYYLNSRYYNPIANRFITMDEIEYLGASGSALSYNLYSYCENNPVNNVDPNGNVRINIKWLATTINIIIIVIPALFAIAKVWSTVSKSTSKIKKFIDVLVKSGNKLMKKLDDRLYCMFAKTSTYLWVKTIGIALFTILDIIGSIGSVIQYVVDILDGKWDGYLDTKKFNPKLDFTKDY